MFTNPYDDFPYESHPFNQTHPANLQTIGNLFGINAADFRKARILELGCASGGNIIPIAFYFPETEIIGIDYSDIQIKEGQKIISDLDLKNISLQNLSISDIDKSYGRFDYIICFGILSWVTENIQEKIFSICKTNLKQNGIACISYNTLPGWSFVKPFRDMMLYHTKDFHTPQKKVEQAKAMLKFVSDTLENSPSPYTSLLNSEIEIISERNDCYLLHDHLEENNTAFYFREFVKKAEDNELKYLGDMPVEIMYHYNLPEKTAEYLDSMNDIVEIGQYMDFLRNQRFRTTLICHNDLKIDRNISLSSMENFYFSMTDASSENANPDILINLKEITFSTKVASVTVSHEIAKTAMIILMKKNGIPISYSNLCNEIMNKTENNDLEEIKSHLNKDLCLLRLVITGILNIFVTDFDFKTTITEKPVSSKLARYQAAKNKKVTNKKHESVFLNPVERVMIQYLNGKYTFNEIIENMIGHFLHNELELVENGQKVENKERIIKKVTELCNSTIEKFRIEALLTE
jgi:methyltransferase-like protein/2-polyprenyl-3-methyl-5-hydroxy-6-metoxy-1,4-benzoquinol methylase